ncbi:MAG: YdiU family protein [Rhizobiaceae bacterium]
MATAFNFDNSYARLPERFYARLNPKPVEDPRLIRLNEKLAKDLGLDLEELKGEKGLQFFSGNKVSKEADPIAMAYAGMQFGGWSPQLGDGRALLLGEIVDAKGQRFDVQLKGSGPTPFSRRGDGRAWIGPVLREYIVSEAMHALGVPTTRALAAVSTGEDVRREQTVPGAILTRVALSHVRVGTFQYFAARNDDDALKLLADYVIERLHPEVKNLSNPYIGLLEAVIEKQVALTAKWMNLGFIHGVMNTDNVTISGETIDYGPCAFMDEFHPDRVFSSIDEQGRYSYSNQPRITHWNMVQFAQSLLPLLGETEEQAVAAAQAAVNEIPTKYMLHYQTGLNAKLGLGEIKDGDTDLGKELLGIMAEQKADFTLAFRYLAEAGGDFLQQFDDPSAMDKWLDKWRARCSLDKLSDEKRAQQMLAVNPAFIPRNHSVEHAIVAALEGDIAPFEQLVETLENPFIDQPDNKDLMASPMPNEIVHFTFCGT